MSGFGRPRGAPEAIKQQKQTTSHLQSIFGETEPQISPSLAHSKPTIMTQPSDDSLNPVLKDSDNRGNLETAKLILDNFRRTLEDHAPQRLFCGPLFLKDNSGLEKVPGEILRLTLQNFTDLQWDRA